MRGGERAERKVGEIEKERENKRLIDIFYLNLVLLEIPYFIIDKVI